MRWESLRLGGEPPADDDGRANGGGPADGVPDALFAAGAVVRRYDTPQFRDITFYEVHARSILNRVPPQSKMPFEWTINPYRGCTHACVYCFARNTHTYLDLDAGRDFDSRVVVKVNAPALLRQELARPSWRGEHVAMGTNVDCYQRAEGRYQLMPGIITALTERANPFSILTKGTLLLRDLELLQQAARVTSVSINVSVGFVDREMWRSVEPGTPNPNLRLDVCRKLTDAGIGCGVLMAPVLPYLTDSPEQLEATVRAIVDAGARHISPLVLHLRPGAREWYFRWLEEHHPALVPRYRELYGRGSYAPRAYTDQVTSQVHDLARRMGMGRRTTARGPTATRRAAGPASASARPVASVEADQLSLI